MVYFPSLFGHSMLWPFHFSKQLLRRLDTLMMNWSQVSTFRFKDVEGFRSFNVVASFGLIKTNALGFVLVIERMTYFLSFVFFCIIILQWGNKGPRGSSKMWRVCHCRRHANREFHISDPWFVPSNKWQVFVPWEYEIRVKNDVKVSYHII